MRCVRAVYPMFHVIYSNHSCTMWWKNTDIGSKDSIKGEDSKSNVKQQKKWERGLHTISSWHLDNGWVKKIRRHLISLNGITK